MHSFGYRANAVLTFAVTILAVMCTMASLSDNLNVPSPSAHAQVLNINWFQKQRDGNDEVSLTLNISADLQSMFTWNTKQVFVFIAAEYETPQNALNQVWNNGHGGCKGPTVTFLGRSRAVVAVLVQILFVIGNRHQVSLWDGIIPSKEHAKFSVHTTNKYRFKDQGSNLRGKEFNLTLHWHVMPKTGKMFADKIVMTGYRLPQEYR